MKKFSRGLVLLCVASAIFVPASSYAEAMVYGKLLLGLEKIDKEVTPSQPNNTDRWEVKSYSSRFGVKGSTDTDYESLKVVYKLEWGVDVTDENKSSKDHLMARDQYAGLKGNFGEIIFGRHDTPFKASQGKVDIFGDVVDMKIIMAGSEVRVNNIWQYTSPKIADKVSIKVMGIPGEDSEIDPTTNNARNGIADATSLSVSYDDDMLHIGFASDGDVAGEGIDATRFVAIAKLGNFGVGALIQSTDYKGGLLTPAAIAASGATTEEEVILVSAYAKVNKFKFKVQVGAADNYGGAVGVDADYTALGVDYSLAKKTTLGFYVADREGGDSLEVTTPLVVPVVKQSQDRLGFTLIHSF